jgi:hypothetical protein
MFTPAPIFAPLFDRLDLKNKRIMVLYNPEAGLYLLNRGVPPTDIFFAYDTRVKAAFLGKLGVPESNFVQIDPVKRSFPLPVKIDVFVTNPPYTDNSQGAVSIYRKVLENCLSYNPEALAVVCPRELLRSPQCAALRNRLIDDFEISYLRYLSDEDWEGQQVKIGTLAFVCKRNNGGSKNTLVVNTIGNTFQQNLKATRVAVEVGRKVELMELVNRIQTQASLKFHGNGKDTIIAPAVDRISVSGTYTITPNPVSVPADSVDVNKVVIGYFRTNALVVVPKGVGVQPKHRFLPVSSEAEAQKWCDYLKTTLIQLIAAYSRTGKTADSAQFSLIPCIDLSQFPVVNDGVLRQHFGIDDTLWQIIEDEYKWAQANMNTGF